MPDELRVTNAVLPKNQNSKAKTLALKILWTGLPPHEKERLVVLFTTVDFKRFLHKYPHPPIMPVTMVRLKGRRAAA